MFRIRAGHVPEVWFGSARPDQDAQWKRLAIPAGVGPKDEPISNHLLVDDLVAAIDERREAKANGRTARWTIEMAHGLYASQRTGGRVKLPLEKREHPL